MPDGGRVHGRAGPPVTEEPNRKRFIVHDDRSRRKALVHVASIPVENPAAPRYYVEIGECESDRPSQIRHVMGLCNDLSKQLAFPGTTLFADAEGWYRLLIGLMRGERFVREGQIVVMIGAGLSSATRSEREDLIRFIEAYGAERGVRFTDRSRMREG
jgi:hypothetical protein